MSALQPALIDEFDGRTLGNVLRGYRAALMGTALVLRGGSSLAQAMGSKAAAKGCYRLLNRPDVEHDALLAGHIANTVARAADHPVVLAIQDTTAFSYGERDPIEGLGPIDSGVKVQGFFAHTTLLVEPVQGEVLGVGHQHVWARDWTAAPRDETPAQRKKRPRESQHWADGQLGLAKAMGRSMAEDGRWSPPAKGAPHVIAVFDREGDIYEALVTVKALGHGFVIRAVHDRLINTAGDPEGAKYSMTKVEGSESLGSVPFVVPRRGTQKERSTVLTVRSVGVNLRPPKNINRRGDDLGVNMLLVREESPAPGVVTPVCWYLLTSEPCSTLAEALAVVEKYRRRWKIEEFHMGLKTGCGVERAQLESLRALENFVAIASVAAWRLLCLRDAARSGAPAAPAHLVSGMQLRILQLQFPALGPTPSARSVLRAIATLGGFWGRKSDGEPGWRTLWWGWQRLSSMEAGAALFEVGVPRRGQD